MDPSVISSVCCHLSPVARQPRQAPGRPGRELGTQVSKDRSHSERLGVRTVSSSMSLKEREEEKPLGGAESTVPTLGPWKKTRLKHLFKKSNVNGNKLSMRPSKSGSRTWFHFLFVSAHILSSLTFAQFDSDVSRRDFSSFSCPFQPPNFCLFPLYNFYDLIDIPHLMRCCSPGFI